MNNPNFIIEQILCDHPHIFSLLFIKENETLHLKDKPRDLIKNTSFFSSGESVLRDLVLNLYNGGSSCSVLDLKRTLDRPTQRKVFSALLNSVDLY
jgi:hypothetical protein